MEYWKWRTIDRLKDYEAQKAARLNLRDEIATLQAEASALKSPSADSIQASGRGSRAEDRLLSNIVRREELAPLLRRAESAVRSMDRALATLSDEDRHMLQIVYISQEPGAIRRLADELCLADESSVYRRLDKAVRRCTMALYGATES